MAKRIACPAELGAAAMRALRPGAVVHLMCHGSYLQHCEAPTGRPRTFGLAVKGWSHG